MRRSSVLLIAFLLAGSAFAAATPQSAVTRFYTVYIKNRPPGLPSSAALEKLRPFLSDRLYRSISAALDTQRAFIKEHPGEKPPFIDGDYFSSNFEGPASVEILRTSRDKDRWNVRVRFRYESVSWEDVIVLTQARGRYVIDDVIYGGAGDFNPPGRLSDRLKTDDDDVDLQAAFRTTTEAIEQRFVRSVPADQLLANALDGMLKQLDPYSRYLSPADWKFTDASLHSTIGGIGVFLAADAASNGPFVEHLMRDSAAAGAGVRRGDVVLEIDGKSTEGMPVQDVVLILRGEPGTSVELLVRHPDSKPEEHLRIRRVVVSTPTVRGYRRASDGEWDYFYDHAAKIGYIRVSRFADDSGEAVERALSALRNSGASSFILDLRGNPGGRLKAATATADLFLESGRIVTVFSRKEVVAIEAKPGGFTAPMMVLVDDGTASAAEVLAAALQDNGRAKIVGRSTYGKGYVQELFPLGDRGGFRMTTAAYLRPSGTNIDRHRAAEEHRQAGVAPDEGFEVVPPPDESEALRGDWFLLDNNFVLTDSELRAHGDRALERAAAALGSGRAP